MARETLLIVSFLLVFHRVLSQVCPSGTPDGCRCENRVFNCSGVALGEVPSSISSLTDSTEYDSIDLSNTNLGSLPTGSFKGLANIQTIVLSKNQITTISPGAFDVLSSLLRVDLQQNSLTTLDQTGFNLVNSLRELHLDENSISCDTGIDWLKAWEDSVQTSSTLTGTCASGGTLESYLSGLSVSDVVLSIEKEAYEVKEGDGMVSVAVVRRGMASERIQFDLGTSDGTTTGSEDFIAPTISQTMLQGQTRMVIDILVVDDAEIEANENFMVSLSVTARGEGNIATVGTPSSATVTIMDNDTPPQPEPETTPEPRPEPETTPEPKPEPTKMMEEMTTKSADQNPEAVSAGVNVAAVVVPIILVLVIIAAVVAFYFYYQSKAASKGTTAGVRYAAVQNKGKVYGDVTAKA